MFCSKPWQEPEVSRERETERTELRPLQEPKEGVQRRQSGQNYLCRKKTSKSNAQQNMAVRQAANEIAF